MTTEAIQLFTFFCGDGVDYEHCSKLSHISFSLVIAELSNVMVVCLDKQPGSINGENYMFSNMNHVAKQLHSMQLVCYSQNC